MNPQDEALSVTQEPDMSWFDIAVTHRKEVVILGNSPGWEDFAIEHWWEDNFINDAPGHLTPGAYRWTGFKVGFWSEGDHLNVTGGEFIPLRLSHSTPGDADVMRKALEQIAKDENSHMTMAEIAREALATPSQGEVERECQAVWRCAIGDFVGAMDVLKNQMAGSRRKEDRRIADVLAPTLALIWAARNPAPQSYDEAAKAGSALIARVRSALSPAAPPAQDQGGAA